LCALIFEDRCGLGGGFTGLGGGVGGVEGIGGRARLLLLLNVVDDEEDASALGGDGTALPDADPFPDDEDTGIGGAVERFGGEC